MTVPGEEPTLPVTMASVSTITVTFTMPRFMYMFGDPATHSLLMLGEVRRLTEEFGDLFHSTTYDLFRPWRPQREAHQFLMEGLLQVVRDREVWSRDICGGTSYEDDWGSLAEFRSVARGGAQRSRHVWLLH